MGLDTYIYKMVEMPQDRIVRDVEIPEDVLSVDIVRVDRNKNFTLPGAEKYLFRLSSRFLDASKIRKHFSLDKSWKVIGMEWFEDKTWIHMRKGEKYKKLLDPGDNTLYRRRVYWAICVDPKELGYLRKGANERFYKEDIWNHPPVCTKALLRDHMKKYFMPDQGFKALIYDKFKDGQGMCVCYA